MTKELLKKIKEFKKTKVYITCGLCSKFNTDACNEKKKEWHQRSIVQGGFPWQCLYREDVREKIGEDDEVYAHIATSRSTLEIESVPEFNTLYNSYLSNGGLVLKNNLCPKLDSEGNSDQELECGCDELDADGKTGHFCPYAIRLLDIWHRRWWFNDFLQAPKCFVLRPDYEEYLRALPFDYDGGSKDGPIMQYVKAHDIKTIGDFLDKFSFEEFMTEYNKCGIGMKALRKLLTWPYNNTQYLYFYMLGDDGFFHKLDESTITSFFMEKERERERKEQERSRKASEAAKLREQRKREAKASKGEKQNV